MFRKIFIQKFFVLLSLYIWKLDSKLEDFSLIEWIHHFYSLAKCKRNKILSPLKSDFNKKNNYYSIRGENFKQNKVFFSLQKVFDFALKIIFIQNLIQF